MSTQAPLNRRDALRLGVIGSAIALGNPLFVAQSHAQKEAPPDQGPPTWKMAVQISGLPMLSAGICGLSLDDLLFEPRQGAKTLEGRLVIRAMSTPEVRKEVREWFRAAHEPKAVLRGVKILLTHRDGVMRTWHFQEAFPTRFSGGDFTTGAETCLETIEVAVTRVEMA